MSQYEKMIAKIWSGQLIIPGCSD